MDWFEEVRRVEKVLYMRERERERQERQRDSIFESQNTENGGVWGERERVGERWVTFLGVNCLIGSCSLTKVLLWSL